MTIESQPWYVHHHRVNKDYIKIENLQQWLVTDVPNINPNHPKYIDFWSRQTKKCIEGMWGNEFGKHRYMPGNLYFFGNYGIIEHSWEDERGVKITEDIKPFIVDFIWDYAYQSWVCRGFSGFEKDEEYSCNIKLKAYYEDKIALSDLPRTCIHNGQPKKYEDAFEYLRRLHNKKLGKSLYPQLVHSKLTCISPRGHTGISSIPLYGVSYQLQNPNIRVSVSCLTRTCHDSCLFFMAIPLLSRS